MAEWLRLETVMEHWSIQLIKSWIILTCNWVANSGIFRIPKRGATFLLATSAQTKGGQTKFSNFFLWWKNFFLPKGSWPNGPLNTPLVANNNELGSWLYQVSCNISGISGNTWKFSNFYFVLEMKEKKSHLACHEYRRTEGQFLQFVSSAFDKGFIKAITYLDHLRWQAIWYNKLPMKELMVHFALFFNRIKLICTLIIGKKLRLSYS